MVDTVTVPADHRRRTRAAGEAMDIRLRYVHQDVDRHGNVRTYFKRPNERKVRLRGEPGSAPFLAAYHAAREAAEAGRLARPLPVETERGATPGTFAWLCRAYEMSADFRALEPITQRIRRGIIATMLAEPVQPGRPETFRDYPLEHMRLAALEVLRDRKVKAGAPGAANNRVKTLRRLCTWAVQARELPADISAGLRRVTVNPAGIHSWSEAEVAQFERHHCPGSRACLALALILYTGARRSDVHTLGRQHVRDGCLVWKPYKGRKRSDRTITLPILPALQAVIDQSPVGDLTFVVSSRGRPYGRESFGNWFKKMCRAAGLPHCSAHGLRKASATRMAEAGATTHMLMAAFGWDSLAEAERYTRAAECKRLAAAGIAQVAAAFPPPADASPVGTRRA